MGNIISKIVELLKDTKSLRVSQVFAGGASQPSIFDFRLFKF